MLKSVTEGPSLHFSSGCGKVKGHQHAMRDAHMHTKLRSVRDDQLSIIKVVNHKTAAHGSAKSVFDAKDWDRLREYTTYIHRYQLSSISLMYR